MPRGTSKKSANQHNNRHENGIVAPGKRIAKQRSNGQLRDRVDKDVARDQAAASSSDASSTRPNTPPVPSPCSPPPPSASDASALHQRPVWTAQTNGRPAGAKDRSSLDAQAQLVGDGKEQDKDSATMDAGKAKVAEQMARKLEVVAPRAAAPGVDAGASHPVTTIITSRSLVDSITLLIFLMSLPPSFHAIINALFALATFVPPSGSFSSLPTLSDFVSSFSPTTPSFAVMALIDFIAWFLWQFLPNAGQALVIDFAQAVVATTLGGGYSNSRPGSPDNTLVCLAFAFLTHLMTQYKTRIFKQMHRTWIGRWAPQFDVIEDRPLSEDYPAGHDRNWFDTIKVVLALHILCQGITKMVRRSIYSSRSSTTSALPAGGRDLEVAGAAASGVDVGESLDHPRHGAQLRSKESLANLRDVNRDKISSGKRRRKQGNYTRSQQPLWAAFASTKASMTREYLAGDAKNDSIGTGALDKDNLGDSPFEVGKNKIWITRTKPNSLFFETSHLDSSRLSSQRKEGDEAGIDKTRPLYVRINGADWLSVKMASVPESEDNGRFRWVGEVYGLSPTFSYQIHFIRSDDDVELHVESIVTPAATIRDSAASVSVVTPAVLSSSPASPTETLRVSISSTEARIEDILERTKRFRRETKQTQSSLRKEIETLTDKISKTRTSHQNLQARHARETQHIRQAEDAITTMTEELDAFKEIPEDEIEEWRQRKAEYESTRSQHRDAKNELVKTKELNQRAILSLQAEANKEERKNARAEERVTRLKAQHQRLANPEAPTAQGADALRSNSGPSGTRAQQYAAKAQEWRHLVESRQRVLQQKQMEYQSKAFELSHLQGLHQQQQLQQQQHHQQHHGRARTPSEDGDIPGTGPQPPSTGNSRFFDAYNHGSNIFGTPDRSLAHPFEPPGFAPSPVGIHKTNSTGGHGKTRPHTSSFGARPRSTSIMSGNTVYQDVDDSSGNTDATVFEQLPNIPIHQSSVGPNFYKRRSGGIHLHREGSNGSNSNSLSERGSPRVLGGVIRPPVQEDRSRDEGRRERPTQSLPLS